MLKPKIPQHRRRFSDPQRSQHLIAYRRSGLSQRLFADRAGIALSTLTRWLRGEMPAGTVAEAAFVELPPITSPAAPLFCRLQLPGGIILEIPPGFPAEEVRHLAMKFLVP